MPDLSTEDRAAIRSILLAERERGVAEPLLPIDVDVDGDGTADSFGLNESDEVVVVSGVSLERSIYVSGGDDVIEHDPDPEV